MSKAKRYSWIVGLAALSMASCQKKEKPEATATTVAEPTAKAPEITPEQKLEQDVEALAAVIDMPEDYISAAEEEITDDNLAAELEKLEKELSEEELAANPEAAATAKPAIPLKAPVKPATPVKPAAPAKPATP